MTYSPFFPTAEQLPSKLPIFPLVNAVVMPHVDLPLNIFEPRYLNMVNDALATHHLIGMIQPNLSPHVNLPSLYRTGCAGRVTSYSETRDGRMLISLTGVCRFDIGRELPGINGYRIIEPVWHRFLEDLNSPSDVREDDKKALAELLKQYFEEKKIIADWDLLEQMDLLELVHTMTVLMPLEDIEKQAVLEALSLTDRVNTLKSALQFGFQQSGGSGRH